MLLLLACGPDSVIDAIVWCSPQTQVHPRKDSIYVDGRSLPKNVESLYFCLNKPKGYMCSNDPNGKKLVVDLFEDFMLAWVRRWTC